MNSAKVALVSEACDPLQRQPEGMLTVAEVAEHPRGNSARVRLTL